MKITKISNEEFKIEISTDSGETTHMVVLDDQYWERLTNKEISKEELIEKSFNFLLEHESNQSILKSFNLKEINNYFPSFEKGIVS